MADGKSKEAPFVIFLQVPPFFHERWVCARFPFPSPTATLVGFPTAKFRLLGGRGELKMESSLPPTLEPPFFLRKEDGPERRRLPSILADLCDATLSSRQFRRRARHNRTRHNLVCFTRHLSAQARRGHLPLTIEGTIQVCKLFA
jgi:hypothetical protein